jgi:serine/threonine protein kinase
MGRVYLGRSAAGRLVAVKTIKIEFAEEPDFRTRFASEISAARRVSGAFTAPVVAADPEADVPWLATAYVPAPPLSALVQACGPLPVPAVRWLAAGCAEALESIHGVGLVHRDLKPSNVLVSPDGPRVIDFGVARAAERVALTITRGAVGTPAYMAPEQARDTSRATTASDVYSLGATILYAATGHGPYAGDSVMDVLVHLATDLPDLSGLPAELTGVVAACLERDPRRRPTSATVLAHLAPDRDAENPFGSVPLPATAFALIDAYRQDPRPASQPGPRPTPEDTLGSQPGRSGPLAPRRPGARHSASQKAAPARPLTDSGTGGQKVREPFRKKAVLGASTAVAALALLAAGVAAGADLVPGRVANASQRGKDVSSGHHASLPPFISAPGIFILPGDPGGQAIVALNQRTGDQLTGFVVEGRGWPPLQPVTVRIAGFGRSAHDTADAAGTFDFGINQDHVFFSGRIPVGRHRVIVTGSGIRESITFTVHRVPARPKGPPPGTRPGSPPGSPPPSP